MMCRGVIPNTFITCGEGGNYCSDECLVRAVVETLRKMTPEQREFLLLEASDFMCRLCGGDAPCYCADGYDK